MDLGKTAEQAVDAALSAGAGDAEAYVQDSVGREIRVFEGEVESLTEAGERGLGVRCWIDHRSGYAYGTELSDEGVGAIAAGAVEAARIADPDEFAAAPSADGAAARRTSRGSTTRRSASGRPSARSSSPRRSSGRRARPTIASSAVETTVYADEEERVAIASSTGLAGSLRGDHRLRLPPGDRRRRRRQADRPRLRHGALAGGPRRRGDRPRGRGARGLVARRRKSPPRAPARSSSTRSSPPASSASSAARCAPTPSSAAAPRSPAAWATPSPRRPSRSPTTPPTPPASTHLPSTPRAPPTAERR